MRLDQLLPLAQAFAQLPANAQNALAAISLDGELIEDQPGLDLWHARGFLHLAENAEIVDAADYGHEIDALQAHRARVEAHYAG